MTLKQWSKKTGVPVKHHPGGGTYVYTAGIRDENELWELKDHVVSTVSGPVVWLEPRPASKKNPLWRDRRSGLFWSERSRWKAPRRSELERQKGGWANNPFELHYGTGGHGGPYQTLRSAHKRARDLLVGMPRESFIKVIDRDTRKPVTVVGRKYGKSHIEFHRDPFEMKYWGVKNNPAVSRGHPDKDYAEDLIKYLKEHGIKSAKVTQDDPSVPIVHYYADVSVDEYKRARDLINRL